MTTSPYPWPLSARLSRYVADELDPDNAVAWLPRWAARGVNVRGISTWEGRVLHAVSTAAKGQRRVPHEDAGQMILQWLIRHPYQLHRWGCPDEGCGPDDGPKSAGFLAKVFGQKLVDAIRRDWRDLKKTVDGKQVRVYPKTLEVPASSVQAIGDDGDELETIEATLHRLRSSVTPGLHTVALENVFRKRQDDEYEAVRYAIKKSSESPSNFLGRGPYISVGEVSEGAEVRGVDLKQAEWRMLPSNLVQRPVRFRAPDEWMVDRIVNDYVPLLDAPVLVSARHGHLRLIDGATRRQARRLLGYHDICAVVLPGLSDDVEDELYEMLNREGNSVPLTAE